MDLLARNIMHRDVQQVAPDLALPALEDEFIKQQVSGFPVVEQGSLVGVVSKADVIRQLNTERKLAETTSDYYADESGFHEIPLASWRQIADRVGERNEHLCVRDVMTRHILSVGPDQPLREVAQMLAAHHIRRVLVTLEGRLLGIISALDIIQLVADGRLKES